MNHLRNVNTPLDARMVPTAEQGGHIVTRRDFDGDWKSLGVFCGNVCCVRRLALFLAHCLLSTQHSLFKIAFDGLQLLPEQSVPPLLTEG